MDCRREVDRLSRDSELVCNGGEDGRRLIPRVSKGQLKPELTPRLLILEGVRVVPEVFVVVERWPEVLGLLRTLD